jgi:hypothetical protein
MKKLKVYLNAETKKPSEMTAFSFDVRHMSGAFFKLVQYSNTLAYASLI